MRVVFFGTPELAVRTLEALGAAGHEVVLVVTQPDKRRGRSSKPSPSPVKAAADRLGLAVSHTVKDALGVQADLGVLVAFGRLIKPDILASLNIINLHPSLLPRWRGATPVEGAILAGDTTTGICLMQLVEAMDAGPVYQRYETEIAAGETAASLYARLLTKGNEMLLELLSQSELPVPAPQAGEPTFCGKITPEDLHIDWAQAADRAVRITRVGRAWTTFRTKRLFVLDAVATTQPATKPPGTFEGVDTATAYPFVATGESLVCLRTVQPEGRGPQDAKAWANGARIALNEQLGQ